jgi:hypothetical protein
MLVGRHTEMGVEGHARQWARQGAKRSDTPRVRERSQRRIVSCFACTATSNFSVMTHY